MRTIITVITLLLTTCCWCQQNDTIGHFTIENDNIVWKKVYQSDATYQDLLRWASRKGKIQLEDGEFIKVVTPPEHFPTKELGYKWATTPVLFNEEYSVSFSIEVREGRYRVVVDDIMIGSPKSAVYKIPESINNIAYNKKKKKWRSSHASNVMPILDNMLDYIFTYKEEVKEDW